VVETAGRLSAIEIKATDAPGSGMRRACVPFGANTARRSGPGSCCTTERPLIWLSPDVFAAPWWRVC
jgi:hypothetical protein